MQRLPLTINGNIVEVVVSQLNKIKFAKATGSTPENVNFGIKASTVRQFLTSSGLTAKWSKRSKGISTKELAKIAKNQTVMVVCHRSSFGTPPACLAGFRLAAEPTFALLLINPGPRVIGPSGQVVNPHTTLSDVTFDQALSSNIVIRCL